MHRLTLKPYLLLMVAFAFLASVPVAVSDRLRSSVVMTVAPTWGVLHQIRMLAVSPASYTPTSTKNSAVALPDELERLRMENRQLRQSLEHLEGVCQQALSIGSGLSNRLKAPLVSVAFAQRRHDEMLALMQLYSATVPARVIFRSPAAWNSSLWINVGQVQNESLGYELVAKNSPVVIGTALVGVVDYVGKKQSRVRLITDSGLTPSVRALRNSSLGGASQNIYLAKGELLGSSYPLWRGRGDVLRGLGFNYDNGDEEGPARDLRTGEVVGAVPSAISRKVAAKGLGLEAVPILLANDLLVTTGMDGVFPAGLHVATVSKIEGLKEGSYTYELQALPVVKNMDELSLVFVLPPLGFDPSDLPPRTLGY